MSVLIKAIKKFLLKEVLTRYGCYDILVVDGGAENKAEVIVLIKRIGFKQVVISAYYPRVNRMIERGHNSREGEIQLFAGARDRHQRPSLEHPMHAQGRTMDSDSDDSRIEHRLY